MQYATETHTQEAALASIAEDIPMSACLCMCVAYAKLASVTVSRNMTPEKKIAGNWSKCDM